MTQETLDCIRYNLNLFGYEDMIVVGEVQITRDGFDLHTEKTQPLRLSVICARHRQILTEIPHNPNQFEKANAGIKVLSIRPHVQIGKISDSDHFYYEKAPSLEVALGWLIATSLGQSTLIDLYPLNKYAEEIKRRLKRGQLTDKFLSKILRQKTGNPEISLSLAREMFSSILKRIGG